MTDLTREISSRLETFLESNLGYLAEINYLKRNENLNLEAIIDLMINKVFAKNNWRDIENWIIIFYILTGRFGLKNELIAFRWGFQKRGVLGVVLEVERYFNDWESRDRIKFVSLPPNSICIDISHSLNYPFNTGIQTVVRKIGECLLMNPKVYWVIWNDINQVWQLVEKDTVSFRLPFQKKSKLKGEKIARKLGALAILIRALWHGLFSSYRYLISNQEKESKLISNLIFSARKNFQKLRTRYVNINNQGEIFSPLLIDQTLLIVEPIQGDTITKRLYYLTKVTKVSVLVYDLIPISNPEFFNTSSIHNFLNYLKVLSLANNLIAISEFTLNQIRKFVPNSASKHLAVIHLPSSLDNSIADSSGNFNTPIFLSVGSIEPRKNHMNILKAAQECWDMGLDFELVLVGGQGWANSDVNKYILNLKTNKYKIRVIRDASSAQILRLYSQAYAFITVPWVEGFGLPLAEAISTGKPVIASKIDSHLEFGQVDGVHFVNPDEIDMISTTMKKILNYRATNAHKVIQRKPQLSWDEYSTKLISDATK